MPLSNASRLADFGTGIGTAGAIIQVDNANQRLGVGTTAPTATLGVAGIVSATAFYGDGSNLDGVASAGLGTALSEEEFNPLTVIYQTSDTLSVGATITVDPPDATSKVAYTQYSDIKLEGDADLIVADGDDFIPDILGLSTEGFSFSNANGNGVFDAVYTDNIENSAGRGGPNFPLGMTVSGIATFNGNVSIGGTLTYEDVTNVDSIGVVTARNGIDITGASAGLNASSNLRLKTAGAERVNITSTGLGIGVNNPSQILEVQGGSAAKPTFKHSAGWGALRVAGSAGGSGSGFILANNYNGTIEEKWSIYLDGSNDGLRFTAGPPETTSAERLRIGSAGQIGLSGANYGTSGQVMTSQGASAAPQWATVAAGMSEYDQWTVTVNTNSGSNINGWTESKPWGGSTTPATVNLARTTTTQNPLFAKIGTGVSKDSNGYWTFPSTGYWEVRFLGMMQAQYSMRMVFPYIRVTTDGGSSWNTVAKDFMRSLNSSNKPGPCRPITTLLNITNTTNQKMYVSCLIEDGGIVFGETSEIQSNIIFKKVA